MLHEQNVNLALWAEAISTSTYLKNRSPTKALDNQTPEEAWTGVKSTIAHLRPFGCKAYAHIPAQNRSKLHAKTVKCLLVGYSTKSKAYRLYDPAKGSIIITCDVVFDESAETSNVQIIERQNKPCKEVVRVKDQVNPDTIVMDCSPIDDSDKDGS